MVIRQYRLADGTLIDATMSGRCAGPGEGGQHYGTSYLFYRINGGDWRHSKHRHLYRLEDWVAVCETLADFMEGETW